MEYGKACSGMDWERFSNLEEVLVCFQLNMISDIIVVNISDLSHEVVNKCGHRVISP